MTLRAKGSEAGDAAGGPTDEGPQARVAEPGKEVPVHCDVDVAVVGGGISGTMAAIAAARHRARTIVIDRFGQVGGNIGPGMFAGGTLHLALKDVSAPNDVALINRMGMGGIPEEFHRRVIFSRPNADRIPDDIREELERKHLNVGPYRMGSGAGLPGYFVDSLVASHVALEMFQESGVETLLSVYAGDPIMEGTKVRGIFVETKSGRLAVRARVVVDATGEADVAFRAGAPVLVIMAPSIGLYYSLGGVDWAEYERFCEANPTASEDDVQWAKEYHAFEATEADPYPSLQPILSFLRKASESGEFQYFRRVGKGAIRATQLKLTRDLAEGRTGMLGEVDFSDAAQVSLMECEHRKYVFQYASFFRKWGYALRSRGCHML